jgi:hypothetical protein
MLIAWFEGTQSARLVVTGPTGQREEIQIRQIAASLKTDVNQVLSEPDCDDGEGPLTARLQLVLEHARAGKAKRLGNRDSHVDRLCEKLVAMAALLAHEVAIKRSLKVLQHHF